MTKTEQIKHLTKSVIIFMEALGYWVVNDESGNLTFSRGSINSDNNIDYHRTYQDVYVLSWASPQTTADADKLEKFIKLMKQDLAL